MLTKFFPKLLQIQLRFLKRGNVEVIDDPERKKLCSFRRVILTFKWKIPACNLNYGARVLMKLVITIPSFRTLRKKESGVELKRPCWCDRRQIDAFRSSRTKEFRKRKEKEFSFTGMKREALEQQASRSCRRKGD